MAITVTCPCGERFVLHNPVFPRTVACHRCGGKAVVLGPGAVAGAGWEAEELPEEAGPTLPVPAHGGWVCHECREPAVAACPGCGRPYCPEHGGRSPLGWSCAVCFDARRPMLVVAAVVLGIAGLAILVWGPAPPPDTAPLLFRLSSAFLPFFLLGLAALALWAAVGSSPRGGPGS
ncbi:MAG: hypothetical protein C0501_03780 [Isosphaera sp.]|nr:hypothetical protein [Isosphaera sp.]